MFRLLGGMEADKMLLNMAATKVRSKAFSDEDCAHISTRVQELMDQRGWLQKDVAERTAGVVPQGRLSDLLLHKVRFTERTLQAIADALGVERSDLLPPRDPAGSSEVSETTRRVVETSPRSATVSPVEAYIRERGDELSGREIRFLRRVGFKPDRGEKFDTQFFDRVIEGFRLSNPRPGSS